MVRAGLINLQHHIRTADLPISAPSSHEVSTLSSNDDDEAITLEREMDGEETRSNVPSSVPVA